jgi:hypothetical protein
MHSFLVHSNTAVIDDVDAAHIRGRNMIDERIFSNEVRVSDPAAVQAILDRYYIKPSAGVHGDRLRIMELHHDGMVEAVAIPLDLLSPKPEENNQDHDDWPPQDIMKDKGIEGFRRLLSEVGPYLRDKLVVVHERRRFARGTTWFGARAYYIESGTNATNTVDDFELYWSDIVAPAYESRESELRLIERTHAKRRSGARRDSLSGFKGVKFNRSSGTWSATLCRQGRRIALGTFPSPEDAAAAYQYAAEEWEVEHGSSVAALIPPSSTRSTVRSTNPITPSNPTVRSSPRDWQRGMQPAGGRRGSRSRKPTSTNNPSLKRKFQ